MCFLLVCASEIDSLHEIDSDSEIDSLLFCFALPGTNFIAQMLPLQCSKQMP